MAIPKNSSSHIKGIEYDAKSRDLKVTFHNDDEYTHHAVHAETYNAIMNVFSPGRYYHASVKRRYPKVTVKKAGTGVTI